MQYFVKQRSLPGRNIGTKLQLIYASKVSTLEFMENPRSFHCHKGQLELLLCLSGSCLIIIDGKPNKVSTGDIVIYNSNSYHQECADQSSNFSLYCIAAKGIRVPGLANDCILKKDAPKTVRTGDSFFLFEMLFSRIYDLVRIDNFLDASLIDNYLHALICEVLSLQENKKNDVPPSSDSKSSIVDQIYNYLSENYTDRITLQTISDYLSFSPDYISHIFNEASGYSPMQYVNALRIGSAQMQLIETDDRIADIAMDVGFNNIGNFNRAFSNFAGSTPRAFRRHHKNETK